MRILFGYFFDLIRTVYQYAAVVYLDFYPLRGCFDDFSFYSAAIFEINDFFVLLSD